MYKIITHTGKTYLTEKPNFIRKHENGCFVLTDEETAEGVAYNGTPYLFADGAVCIPFDSGLLYGKEPDPTTEDRVAALEAENKTLEAQVSAQSEQMDFYEECIAEMATVVYA